MFHGNVPNLRVLDLVFVDADHSYRSVKHDTEIVLRLVAANGLMVWHDYANFGYFNGVCGVPEYLAEFGRAHRVAQLANTGLALWSPSWDRKDEVEF